MISNWAFIGIFFLLAVFFPVVPILTGVLFGPHKPGPVKAETYECGIPTRGPAHIQFRASYYLYALVFLIFDVEIAFMFPCAVIYRDWIARGLGKAAFLEISGFVGILVVGLIYVWRKGDLVWVKTVSRK